MTQELILQATKKAIEEIISPQFGISEQFFKIHAIVYENELPKIIRVDTDHADGTIIVYFAVEKQEFFYAVYVGIVSIVQVVSVYVAPNNKVYFRATSDYLILQELSSQTSLDYSKDRSWNKNDPKQFGYLLHQNSCLTIEPDPGPDELHHKLDKLIAYLEQDITSITNLVNNFNGYIQIYTCFHNGNTMLGGFKISPTTIKRLAEMNISLSFDFSATGNFWPEDSLI